MDPTDAFKYPIPVYCLAHRYYLFRVDHITDLRRNHSILGVLIGTLPQSPQQNIFQGLPLELMAEEAALLVETGLAYIVDDVSAHRNNLKNVSENIKAAYVKDLEDQGRLASLQSAKRAEATTEKAARTRS